MNLYIKGRAIVFALIVWINTVGAAYAHSLPGSVLIFSRDGPQLQVTIQFALEDLVTAFPDIASLEEPNTLGAIPATELAQLKDYFSTHFALSLNSAPLPISLTHAELRLTENHHVGEFVQVVADLTAEVPLFDQAPPLALFYDAVTHEIRSHRAKVYWETSTGDLRTLADFRYDADRQPITLDFQ